MLDEQHAFATIRELARALRARGITSLELVEMFLRRIERYNPKLLAFITVTPELAREQAKKADEEMRAGHDRGPLHGIPWGVKDIYDTKGIRTTWGSPMYKDRIPEHDATAVVRVREAGGVLLGKLATGEFAGGAKDLMGEVRNPWKLDRSALGSSAGPGSATAAGLVTFSLGTDTGGSIIAPSGANGDTGLVPTFGRVSRYGVMSLCWSLDKCGPICRSADDTGLVLHAIAGQDPKDFSCRNAPFPYLKPSADICGLKLGVVRADFEPADEAGTAPLFNAALQKLSDLGAHLEDVALKPMPYAEIYGVINNTEAASAFEHLLEGRQIHELANPDRCAHWFAGRTIPAVDYLRAQRIRTDVIEYAKSLFSTYDALAAPTNIYPAPLIPGAGTGADPVDRTTASRKLPDTDLDHFCYITGVTFMSTRCGFHDGLPIGMKFVAAPFAEGTIISLAHTYEQATDWYKQVPQFLP
jgi:Asp-tRNA(Asn)/Glu-tRNA(Gln) amidotransferase A subunit family amidase